MLSNRVLEILKCLAFSGALRPAAREPVHFHSLVLDGVFSRPTPGAARVFHPLPAPTDEEIAQILEEIHERVTRLLRRCGRLPEDPSPTDPVAEQMPLLAG